MFRPNQPNGPGNRSPMEDVKGGLATTTAAMVSLLLSAPLNEYTQPYVIYLADKSYSEEIADLISIAWMILCFPLCFFAARASIIAGLTAAGIYLAYKFI